MHRRGPDGTGVHAMGRAAFGHRRLKILDLSECGAQPMVDSELGLTCVFNGLIYNFRELRQELEGLGYRFFSHTDTEVLRSEEHTSELQSRQYLVCRLLLEKKKKTKQS